MYIGNISFYPARSQLQQIPDPHQALHSIFKINATDIAFSKEWF